VILVIRRIDMETVSGWVMLPTYWFSVWWWF